MEAIPGMDASKSGLTGAMDASKSAMQQAGSAGGAAMKAAELAKEKARAIDVSSLIDVQYEIDGEEVAVQFGVVRENYTPSFDTAIGADQGDKVQILEGGEEAECAPTLNTLGLPRVAHRAMIDRAVRAGWSVKLLRTGKVGHRDS